MSKESGQEVTLDRSAAERLRELLDGGGYSPLAGLRVGVAGGGCTGFQYKLSIEQNPGDEDHVFESNGMRVIVDPKSLEIVAGSVLSYRDDLQSGGFQVTNPNAVSQCGCGSSFQVAGRDDLSS